MFSAAARRIGEIQLRKAPHRGGTFPRLRRCDGNLDGTFPPPTAPSAAATEAVYALASVAAASSTLVLSPWDRNRGVGEERLASSSSRGAGADDAMSESKKTQPPPQPQPRPSSSRLLFVSLSIVSFLPYINFAAFACLAAIESFRRSKRENEEEEKKKGDFFAVMLSPAALAGFSLFYSLPFLLVALTSESGSGSEHSVFAMESLVLGLLHFQAIRVAAEKREEKEEEEKRRAAEEEAANENKGDDGDDGETTSALFASLAASELERFDARLGLKTAKVARLKELAEAAGVLNKKGRKKKGGGAVVVASAPVTRTKASLAAALAAAVTAEGSSSSSSSEDLLLDFETRDWLTSELAKEVGPLVERKRKQKRRGEGGTATARALEELLEEEEKEGGEEEEREV